MPVGGPDWWLPRGQLVRRMILLFVLASALPILLASAIAYSELVRTVDRQQERALREEAKSTGMSLFGQLQLIKAALDLPPLQNSRSRPLPGDLGEITYESVRSQADYTDPQGLSPVPLSPRLRSGSTVLVWEAANSGAAQLQMRKYLPTENLLVRARIDPTSLASAVAGEGAAVALSFKDGGPPVYDAERILGAEPDASWRRSTWVLPLAGHFDAPDLTITVGEPRQSAMDELGLFKIAIPLVLAGAMSMAVWFAIMLLRRQLGPLQTLISATRRVARREFDVRLDIDTDDEFGQLARDFNSMAENLKIQFSTLESVAEVDRLLLETPSLDQILEALLPRVAAVMGADRIGVLLQDAQLPLDAQVHTHWRGAPGRRPVHRVALQPGWQQICSTSDHAVRAQLVEQALGTGLAEVRLEPLRQGQRVTGLLCLCWLPGNVPSPQSLQIVRDLADRLSVALANLKHEQELLLRARFDDLTGLANRGYFAELLEKQIGDSTAGGQNAALLYIDLDGFKNINDSAGHEAGDQVLVEIAARLRRCAAPGDTVARLGGDEFAVLVGASGSARGPDVLAASMLHALHQPVSVSGLDRPMSASIGLARIPAHGDDSETLLRNADIAMYKAKELGRNRVAAFTPAMLSEVTARVDIEVGLQQAIQRNELSVQYQPIVSAAGMVSAEALLRWHWRGHRLVGPAEFIPIAEQSDLIDRLGAWSLGRVCADLATWRRSGIAPDFISINVAPRQLQSEDFLTEALRVLALNGLTPSDLQLEITESAIGDGQQAQAMIRRLSEHGFRIAMDDFGTGYSSLSHLHRYPFDVVKVDRSFIASIPSDTMSLRLVDAIVRMAHGLDKRVVAEGVESAEQQAVLLELGCDAMQGYLHGEPMDCAAFGAYLGQSRSMPTELATSGPARLRSA
jgi:diguanylate cyclase (GGDEF)-like protein